MGLALGPQRTIDETPKAVGVVSIVIAVLCAAPLGVLLAAPLPWEDQALFGLALFAIALGLGRFVPGRLGVLALMGLSFFCTTRYLLWRVTQTYLYLKYQGVQDGVLGLVFVTLLLGAEGYAFLAMLLGYFQSARMLGRKPTALPPDVANWPSVDVLIPTYNESLTIIKPTILSAKNMDWPKDKMHVYVLDDGRRPEIRDFAQQAGVGYITRTDNRHAKAGNLNHAMTKTSSEFVAIFDCDHVPTRSFLQFTMGGFLQDPKLAVVQTPHHFYTGDPFERNLGTTGIVPNENELFYGVTQDGDDFWNASFFCGSCAVLRRTALEEIGGVAVETVTEDAHTSLRMQRLGWNSAYIKIVQAAGLATATLRAHIVQRTRWARGMTQILCLDNPLLGKGLRIAQRLCYFNSAMHYLHAAPRLIFLTAPLAYLLLGKSNMYGYGWAILAYGLPHIVIAMVANSKAHGRYRHTFWNEVYEAVLSPYILLPTLWTLVNPRGGSFNVTPKNRMEKEYRFDWLIALPYLSLATLNFVALFLGMRMIAQNSTQTGTVLINLGWAMYSLIILGAATATAYEKPEMRENARVRVKLPVVLQMDDGMTLRGETLDLSMGGAAIVATDAVAMPRHGRGRLKAQMLGRDYELPVVIASHNARFLALSFSGLTIRDEEALSRVLFSRADSWVKSGLGQPDRPLVGLARVTQAAVRGYWIALKTLANGLWQLRRQPDLTARRETVLPVALLLGVGLLLWAVLSLRAQPAAPPMIPAPDIYAKADSNAPATTVETRDLESLGRTQPIVLTAAQKSAEIYFAVPLTKVAMAASLQVQFHNSETKPGAAMLRIFVNDIEMPSLPLEPNGGGVRTVSVASEAITSDNTLMFQLEAICAPNCTVKETADLWIRIESSTQLTIHSSRLALANDLRLLPAPFVDPSTQTAFDASFVVANDADNNTLTAAGVVASWLGMLADHRGGHFLASREVIPSGNVVLFAKKDSDAARSLKLDDLEGPVIALRDNPMDPYGKLLAIIGRDSAELLRAARALAAQQPSVSGDVAVVADFEMPAPRAIYDVPRWISVDRPALLTDLAKGKDLAIYPDAGLEVYFRLPPDLYYGPQAYVPLDLRYSATGLREGITGQLVVTLNNRVVARRKVQANRQQPSVHESIPLPTDGLYPNNTLRFTFVYDESAGAERSAAYPSIRLAPASAIDLSGFRHFAAMPDLGLFANSGFPFTRNADLSTTVVVLPAAPSEEQITMYLELLGFFGAETGSPALHLAIATGREAAELRGKDLLIIGSPEDQPLFTLWADQMPVRVDQLPMRANRVGLRDTFRRMWRSISEVAPSLESLVEAPVPPDFVVEGFQLPHDPAHSAVLFASPGRRVHPKVLPLGWSASADDVFGSVSILEGEHYQSFPLVTGSYYTGAASRREAMSYRLLDWFWLLPLVVVGLVLVLARIARQWLDVRAQLRLEGRV